MQNYEYQPNTKQIAKNYLNPIGLVLFYSKTRLYLSYDYIINYEQNDTHGPISSPVSLLLPPLPSQRLLLLLSRLDALILLFPNHYTAKHKSKLTKSEVIPVVLTNPQAQLAKVAHKICRT